MTQSAAINTAQHELFTPFMPLCADANTNAIANANSNASASSSFMPTTSSRTIATPTMLHHWPIVAIFIVVLCGSLLPLSHQTVQKFCGKSLTDAMDMVCVNGYNDKISSSGPAARKRQANDYSAVSQVALLEHTAADAAQAAADAESYLAPTFLFLNTYALSPLAASVYANILSNVRHRRNGGVYDECCRKPCSYAELAAYCRSPN